MFAQNGEQTQGFISDIQRFSIHDGPGIRTTVFLKGCPLKCYWCHNPETQAQHAQIMVYRSLCIHCGSCVRACPAACIRLDAENVRLDRQRCQSCGRCADACPAGALKMSGRWMTPEEVLDILRADAPFYRQSGGGVTFSGGEAFSQPDFLLAILRLCKAEGYATAVDTSGYCKQASIESVLPYTDLFLYDLKAGDERTHIQGTGKSAQLIRSNLRYLSQKGAQLYIRIPVIPGYNDNEEQMRLMATFLASIAGSVRMVELLPFHRLGSAKYAALDREYQAGALKSPTEEKMKALAKPFFSVCEQVELG